MKRPTIVIDPGGLESSPLPGGQLRYVVDLIRGLHELAPPASFAVLGGSPEPIPAIASAFDGGAGSWRYVPFGRPAVRGAMYREQFLLSAALVRERAHLYHGLHTVAPIFAPCPTVATVYDSMYELFPEYAAATRSRPYRLFRWTVRHRVRSAVCISRTTADDVVRLWRVRSRCVSVVYPGTGFVGATPAGITVPGIFDQDRVILSVYNLEPRKNLVALLRAFALVRRPGLRLVLFGSAGITPAREAACEALLDELEIAGATTRTGTLSEEQLGWLYGRAEVFAFPSLYEGFGYPVLEAMAAGSCVVARNASSMAEVVGSAGVLVETGDVSQLAAALERLLTDAGERERLGKLASARAQQFTVRRMAEQTWQAYEAALSGTPS